MKVSAEKDNNFGYEKITIVVDNMPLINMFLYKLNSHNRRCRHVIHLVQFLFIKQ